MSRPLEEEHVRTAVAEYLAEARQRRSSPSDHSERDSATGRNPCPQIPRTIVEETQIHFTLEPQPGNAARRSAVVLREDGEEYAVERLPDF